MNHECSWQWFESQLLPDIPERSIIVMDNAPYHSKVLNKAPNTSTKKKDITEWLVRNNIDHDAFHTKPELLVTVKKYNDRQVHKIDAIARNRGHEVLRLPPYHCHLITVNSSVPSLTLFMAWGIGLSPECGSLEYMCP